jgi:hypothetical protein
MHREALFGIGYSPEGDYPGESLFVDSKVDQLVHQQVLPTLQGGVHAGTFNLEVLDAGLNHQKYDQRQDYSFQELSDYA